MALAPNLSRRQAMTHAVYPAITIYSIGDAAHQAEASDHNPDARGIWHALDIMTETDTANAGAAAVILAWLLADVTDLQYVIHDRVIYGRDEKHGWAGAPYTGSDPHTNHIHVSGKHGSTGKNTATGTGYDTAAEAYTPPVSLTDYMEATMPLSKEDIAAIWTYVVPNGTTPATPAWKAINDAFAAANLNSASPLVVLVKSMQTQLAALTVQVGAITPAALGAAVVAALPPSVTGGLTEAQVGHAVHEQLVAQAAAAASAPEATTP